MRAFILCMISATIAWASNLQPCPSASASTYATAGFACSVGGTDFKGFLADLATNSVESPESLSSILITPVSQPYLVGFKLVANFRVPAGSSINDFTFGYLASAPSGSGFSGAQFSVMTPTAPPGSNYSAGLVACADGTWSGIDFTDPNPPPISCSGTPFGTFIDSQNNQSLGMPLSLALPRSGTANVLSGGSFSGALDDANGELSFAGFQQSLTIASTPEPSTGASVLIGLLGLLTCPFLRRFRGEGAVRTSTFPMAKPSPNMKPGWPPLT